MNEAQPRVLYIDDDEGLRRLARRALERRGYAVELAASGPEGVESAADGGFDVLVVDHYMPGQDGLTTLEQLRALPGAPPVVYVTGSEESRIAVAALKAGATDYVVKTVHDDFFDLLARALEQAMEAGRLRAARDRAERELRDTNAQLKTLLDEVNHRVANSLQLVSAFVQMQGRFAKDDDAKALLADTQRRIQAIAQVHRQLYVAGGGARSVEMAGYLTSLARDLEQTCSSERSPRRLVVEAEACEMPVNRAVSMGVVLNELVSNACKDAYPEGEPGVVRVGFHMDEATRAYTLSVADEGCGMPADGAVKGTGLGSQIIRVMAITLNAKLNYESTPGGLTVTLVGQIG